MFLPILFALEKLRATCVSFIHSMYLCKWSTRKAMSFCLPRSVSKWLPSFFIVSSTSKWKYPFCLNKRTTCNRKLKDDGMYNCQGWRIILPKVSSFLSLWVEIVNHSTSTELDRKLSHIIFSFLSATYIQRENHELSIPCLRLLS